MKACAWVRDRMEKRNRRKARGALARSRPSQRETMTPIILALMVYERIDRFTQSNISVSARVSLSAV